MEQKILHCWTDLGGWDAGQEHEHFASASGAAEATASAVWHHSTWLPSDLVIHLKI